MMKNIVEKMTSRNSSTKQERIYKINIIKFINMKHNQICQQATSSKRNMVKGTKYKQKLVYSFTCPLKKVEEQNPLEKTDGSFATKSYTGKEILKTNSYGIY
jgi:hypothetical protein